MEENLRHDDSLGSGLDAARTALIAECEREEESCLYTSTSFYVWLRTLKAIRVSLWAAGAIGSIVSASNILSGELGRPVITAGFALAGIVMPGLVKAVNLDSTIKEYAAAAATFKNLQGEFRRTAKVSSNKPFSQFESEARKAFTAINEARKLSLTPPEWCFRRAQRKVKGGDYDRDEPGSSPSVPRNPSDA